MGGVAIGATCLVDTYLVLFGFGEAAAAMPPEVPPFLLVNPLGLTQTCLLRVCCEGAGAGALVACPSAVMVAMMSSSCLASVGVRVTLVAAASNSTSTCSASSSEAGGVAIFSLPFLEMTGIKGSSSGSSSFSSWIRCFFLDLEEVLTRVPHVLSQTLPLPLLVNYQLQNCHPLPHVGQIVQQLLS